MIILGFLQYYIIDSFGVLIIASIVRYINKKYLWLTPLVVLLISFLLFLGDLFVFIRYDGIKEGIRLFFINDAVMAVYLFYIPSIIISIIITFIMYCAGYFKTRENKKNVSLLSMKNK